MTSRRLALAVALGAAAAAPAAPAQEAVTTYRPFGTLREQAQVQQAWLDRRIRTVVPALMRKHGIDMWVVPMREYNDYDGGSARLGPN